MWPIQKMAWVTFTKKENTRVSCVDRTVEAIVAHKYESDLLNIKVGFPLQSFVNYAYTKDDKIIEFCKSKYRGDRNKFLIKVFRQDEE